MRNASNSKIAQHLGVVGMRVLQEGMNRLQLLAHASVSGGKGGEMQELC